MDATLAEGLVCHLGFVSDDPPVVIPTMYVRDADRVVVHGSAAARMTRTLGAGVPVCLTVTLLDGVVFARTANNHSMNYRSAVLLGMATAVIDPDAKLQAMRALVERVAPGRWDRIRVPSDQEMRATTILSLPIDEASAKVRTGRPLDGQEDFALSVWAGVVPLRLVAGAPLPDAALAASTEPAADIVRFLRRFSPARGR